VRLVNFKSRFGLHPLRSPPGNFLGYFDWSARSPPRTYLKYLPVFGYHNFLRVFLISHSHILLAGYVSKKKATPGLVFTVLIIRRLLCMFITYLFLISSVQYIAGGLHYSCVCWFICIVSFAGTILNSDQRWKGSE
jgi:hypothetical protein